MSVKIIVLLLSLVLILLYVSGCEPARESGEGLVLPEGNVDNGMQAFVNLECYRCHTVEGIEMPDTEPYTAIVMINLGGEVYRVKTYGELITSITNPNHVISKEYLDVLSDYAKEGDVESLMPSFNDKMTVMQLIDLVSFLDSQYKKVMPDYNASSYGYLGY
jgi:hypothetical protein